jgi:hypothetical protein
LGSAVAAVDDGGGGEDLDAGRMEESDNLSGAASGGDDVFDDDGTFAGGEGEAAAEGHGGVSGAFGEEEPGVEGSGDLVADDEASDGWGGDELDGGVGVLLLLLVVVGGGGWLSRDVLEDEAGEAAAEVFGVLRVLEDEGALEVFGAVQTAGEAEVAAEVGAGGVEEVEDVFALRVHKGLL